MSGMNHTINLGRVSGLSAKEIVERADGLRPGEMTDLQFIERIRGEQGRQGEKGETGYPSQEDIQSAVNALGTDEIPLEGSEDLILSGGVYNGLSSGVGAIDEIVEGSTRFPTSGAVWRFAKRADSHVNVSEITEPKSCTARNGVHESFVTKSSDNYVEVTLPKTANEGDSYICDLCSAGETPVVVDFRMRQDPGSIVMVSSEVPTGKNSVRMEAVFSHMIWHCSFTGYTFTSDSSSSQKKFATIVYSGANRVATAEELYSVIVPVGTNTLSTEYFKTLYGICPIKGWTKSITGTTVEYEVGATVTLVEDQTLTLYPVYEEKSVSASQYILNNIVSEGNSSSSGEASVTPSVSGISSGEKVAVKLDYSVYAYNSSGAVYLDVYKGSAALQTSVNIGTSIGGNTLTGSKTFSGVEVGSTIKVIARSGSKLKATVKIASYTIK